MGHQYRLGNGLNEDNNLGVDVRRLRYLLAMHFSSIRSTSRGSGATSNLSIPEHINLHRLRENTNIVIGHGDDHYHAPIILPTTTTVITNYNGNRSSSSSPLHPRLFGSTITTANRGNNNMLSSSDFSPMSHPNITGQLAGSAIDIYNINNQRNGAIENSSNNSDPIMNNGSTNNNDVGTIITTAFATATTTTTASTKNVDPSQSLSLKRSRSPGQFSRGESSGQSSQPVGISSKRQIISHICPNQDIQSMSFANSSASQMNYSGNRDIPNMLNQHMVNQATATSAEPSCINTTQSQINNISENHGQTGFLPSRINTPQSYITNVTENHGQTGFVGDLPSHSHYINESIHNTRFSSPPRQDHPLFNFIGRRYEARATSAPSFYTPAATEGSLRTTRASTPFHIYNNFISCATSGGGGGTSSSSSSTRSTSWGHNDLNNYNNNFYFFDSVQQENDDVLGHNTTNVQEHVRMLSSDRSNQFQAPTLVPMRPSSFVSPQQPLSTFDPSSSNYLLSPPPSPSGLGYLQTSSTLNRPVTQIRRGRHNRILMLNSRELRAERIRLRREIRSSMRRLRNARSRRFEALSARVDVGLTEDDILTFIQQKTFQTNSEETNTNNQACTICQEDFVDEERIGIINCKHMYHFDCIKQWLMRKNLCPICKRTALKIDQED